MSKTKKKEKPQNDEKFTLVELVRNSEVPFPSIVMDLHREGLLTQFYEELDAEGRLDIEPSLTQAEFDKIIGA